MDTIFIARSTAIKLKYPYGMTREEVILESERGNGRLVALDADGRPFVGIIIVVAKVVNKPKHNYRKYHSYSNHGHRTRWLHLRKLGVKYRPSPSKSKRVIKRKIILDL